MVCWCYLFSRVSVCICRFTILNHLFWVACHTFLVDLSSSKKMQKVGGCLPWQKFTTKLIKRVAKHCSYRLRKSCHTESMSVGICFIRSAKVGKFKDEMEKCERNKQCQLTEKVKRWVTKVMFSTFYWWRRSNWPISD